MTSIAMSYKSYNFKPQTCHPLGWGGVGGGGLERAGSGFLLIFARKKWEK